MSEQQVYEAIVLAGPEVPLEHVSAALATHDAIEEVNRCRCTKACGFPCWQRVGIADACWTCGCPPFPEENQHG